MSTAVFRVLIRNGLTSHARRKGSVFKNKKRRRKNRNHGIVESLDQAKPFHSNTQSEYKPQPDLIMKFEKIYGKKKPKQCNENDWKRLTSSLWQEKNKTTDIPWNCTEKEIIETEMKVNIDQIVESTNLTWRTVSAILTLKKLTNQKLIKKQQTKGSKFTKP